MTGFFDLDGPSFGPAAGGAPDSLVILLHGLGADGDDLIGLAPHWAQLLPRTAFVSPPAPFPCDMAPYGRQWFSLQDRGAASVLSGVQAAAPILNAFIDQQLAAHGLTDDRLALVGFSQGTMMSLYVAPRRAKPVAGVVGYSGMLTGPDLLAQEVRSRPPVLLIHGEADPVVPFQAMESAARALQAVNIKVTTERRPGLPHSIDEVGLVKGGRFLAERFGVAASV
jgi:phospholipase/carboxylesterase